MSAAVQSSMIPRQFLTHLMGGVYYVGTTAGGEFATADEAMAWADNQPWGPVDWRMLKVPVRKQTCR